MVMGDEKKRGQAWKKRDDKKGWTCFLIGKGSDLSISKEQLIAFRSGFTDAGDINSGS